MFHFFFKKKMQFHITILLSLSYSCNSIFFQYGGRGGGFEAGAICAPLPPHSVYLFTPARIGALQQMQCSCVDVLLILSFSISEKGNIPS